MDLSKLQIIMPVHTPVPIAQAMAQGSALGPLLDPQVV